MTAPAVEEGRGGVPARGASSSRGAETRDRIVDAALRTVREVGFAETTARAIAQRGGFNQALIFYHFGSVDDLLLRAFGRASDENVERYRAAVEEVGSLLDLVRIGRRLHAEDLENGSVTAVTQLMAAANDPERGGVLLDRFDAWIQLVEDALGRAAGASPVAAIVPMREAAYAIACLFLGVELLSRLDPERSEAEAVFTMLEAIARLAEEVGPALLGMPPQGA